MSNPSADKILTYLSTLGPIGKYPAPGTMGSIVAAIAGVLIAAQWGVMGLAIATVLVVAIGFPMANAHFRITGQKDASEVIIDEVGGQWLAMLPIPVAPAFSQDYFIWVVVAFALFRLFDIWKPGPIRQAEKLQPYATGVMADDIIAGAVAGAIIMLTTPLFEITAY